MKTSDWIMALAVLLAPVIALQVSVRLEQRRERKRRKVSIFSTLMSTRASGLSPMHVEALNLIDIEFYDDEKVTLAWKNYLDLLADTSLSPEAWNIKKIDLLVDLLHTMAVSLGYHFDKVHIKRSAYFPKGHGEIEEEHTAIRKSLVEILSGKKSLPMHVTGFPVTESDITEAKEVRILTKELLEGKRPININLVPG